MTGENMSAEDAVLTLRAASPQVDLDLADPRSLARSVARLPATASIDTVDGIGEALLAHEMESLLWAPLDAARLILVLVGRGGPSLRLLELSMNYLSMYFQELDETVHECRHSIGAGKPLSEVAASLIDALNEADGVLSDEHSG